MNECNNHAAEIVLGVPKETPNTISDFRSRGLPSNRCRVQFKALGKHKFGSKLRVFVLPSLYSPKNPTVESTVGGGGGGLPGVGMRLEAVCAVDGLADGLADGQGTEEAVRHAVGPADGRVDGSSVGRGRWLSNRRAVARADAGADARRDGYLHPACGRIGGRPPGKLSRPPSGWLCRQPSGRPVDGDADGWAYFHRSERPSAIPRH